MMPTVPILPRRVAAALNILQLKIVIQTLRLRLQVQAGEMDNHSCKLWSDEPDPVVQVVMVGGRVTGRGKPSLCRVHRSVQVQTFGNACK